MIDIIALILTGITLELIAKQSKDCFGITITVHQWDKIYS